MGQLRFYIRFIMRSKVLIINTLLLRRLHFNKIRQPGQSVNGGSENPGFTRPAGNVFLQKGAEL